MKRSSCLFLGFFYIFFSQAATVALTSHEMGEHSNFTSHFSSPSTSKTRCKGVPLLFSSHYTASLTGVSYGDYSLHSQRAATYTACITHWAGLFLETRHEPCSELTHSLTTCLIHFRTATPPKMKWPVQALPPASTVVHTTKAPHSTFVFYCCCTGVLVNRA